MRRLISVLGVILFFSCGQRPESQSTSVVAIPKEKIIIPGKDEPLDSVAIARGKVLIAYSDCYQCHKAEGDAKGPSFGEIAERYPYNEPTQDLLARKIISGGSGVWGYPVMGAHPQTSFSDAQMMVTYILSLDKNRANRPQ